MEVKISWPVLEVVVGETRLSGVASVSSVADGQAVSAPSASNANARTAASFPIFTPMEQVTLVAEEAPTFSIKDILPGPSPFEHGLCAELSTRIRPLTLVQARGRGTGPLSQSNSLEPEGILLQWVVARRGVFGAPPVMLLEKFEYPIIKGYPEL